MQINNVTCYLPIEVLARELDIKLYLALKLVEKGFSIVIGSKSGVHSKMLFDNNPFIYFDKGINPLSWDFYNAIKASKGLIVEIQEEGNVSKNKDTLVSAHNNPSAQLASLIFTWGEHPKKIILENCLKLNKSVLKATGHPSFDLLHKDLINYYHQLAKNIRKVKSGYILVNTNFGHCNGYVNFDQSKDINSNLIELYNEEKKREWEKVERHQKKVFSEFLKLIELLSKSFPKKEIIVRPHPVEFIEIYEKQFRHFENINVVREGSVREWIVDAECVIHHDCTTGIEAFIAGKNVISFCPYYDEKLVAKMPIDVSMKFEKSENLLNYISNNYKDNNHSLTIERQKILFSMRNAIANVEINGTSKIVKNIEELCKNWVNLEYNPLKRFFYLTRIIFKNLVARIKNKIKSILLKNNNINKRKISKFSSLNKDQIEKRLEIWYDILRIKRKFKIEQLGKNTFIIK